MPVRVELRIYRFSRTKRFWTSFGGGTGWAISGGFTFGQAPLGVYHSSVIIRTPNNCFEFEYTMNGVKMVAPGMNKDFVLLEMIPLGETEKTTLTIFNEYARMKAEWAKHPYSLRVRNCHHFSRTFWEFLGFPDAMPDYVLRASRFLRRVSRIEEDSIPENIKISRKMNRIPLCALF